MTILRHALAGLAATLCCATAAAGTTMAGTAAAGSPATVAGATPTPAALPLAASHAQFYSFADVVRLAAGMEDVPALEALEASGALWPGAGSDSASAGGSRPARAVEAAFPAATPEPQYRFLVSDLPGPQLWVLALSGLVAAGWVARRRLRYPIYG